MAGVTDLKAHDEATMAGIVLERKQTLMKQSIKQQHDAQRHYLDNIRVIEHELNDFKLKTGKELEEIKRYGMANIEAEVRPVSRCGPTQACLVVASRLQVQ